MKYTMKFIYLHSSSQETQLSKVRFFRDWVYMYYTSRYKIPAHNNTNSQNFHVAKIAHFAEDIKRAP